MRILSLALIAVLLLGLGACRGSLQSNASSALFVYNNANSSLIANAGTRGALTMHVGDTLQLRVMRRVTDQTEGTTTTNITTTADYNASDTSVITVGQNDTGFAGLITATAIGTTTLEVVYHDPEDPTTDDTADIDIQVLP